jgi:coenzyme F420 hydrogenase subunit beta
LWAIAGIGLRENLRYAFVGLPCHVHALRKLQKRGAALNVRYVIGLFCNHLPDFRYTQFLVERLSDREHEVRQIVYRGDGWPGETVLQMADGNCRHGAFTTLWAEANAGSLKYALDPCRRCPLLFAAAADVSLGDPWGEDSCGAGLNAGIAFSKTGWQLVLAAERDGALVVREATATGVLRTQQQLLERKRKTCR